jgi:hypothetical protein
MLQHVHRAAVLQGAAVTKKTQIVRQHQRFIEIVGYQHHRHGQAPAHGSQLPIKPFTGFPIHRRERFVEKQHAGLAGQRPGHGNPLLLPPGQARWKAIFQAWQVNQCQQLGGPRPAGCSRQAIQGGDDIADGGHVREQSVALKHEPGAAAMGRQADAGCAVEPGITRHLHTAFAGAIKPGDGAQDGGLAAARWTHQPQNFAGRGV